MTTPESPTYEPLTWSSLHSTYSSAPQFPPSTVAPSMQTAPGFKKYPPVMHVKLTKDGGQQSLW